MKKILLFIFTILCFCTTVSSQKIMKIDTDLKANNIKMKAKRTSMTSLGKYYFGPYKVISGKSGWGHSTYKSGMYNDGYTIKSESKKSFVIVGNEKDTVSADIAISTMISVDDQTSYIFREYFNWHQREVNEASENYIATFTSNYNSTVWTLFCVFPAPPPDVLITNYEPIPFQGILSNGDIVIELKQVKQWENGKVGMSPIKGYEFFQNTQSIGAVQIPTGTNWAVWINNDMDSEIKMSIAATAAALMARYY